MSNPKITHPISVGLHLEWLEFAREAYARTMHLSLRELMNTALANQDDPLLPIIVRARIDYETILERIANELKINNN